MSKCKICDEQEFNGCTCEPKKVLSKHLELKFAKQPKPKKKGKTKKEKDHLNWVASQPCIIPECQNPPCVHHIRSNGEPRNHFKTLPICYDHHQGGPDGLHFMGKLAWGEKFGYEMDFLKQLMEKL